MIFPTLAERNRVFGIIERRESFDDLTDKQMERINGMYYCIRLLESFKDDDDITNEDVIDNCIMKMELGIADLYVGFGDINAMDE